jgi:outer membrane protein
LALSGAAVAQTPSGQKILTLDQAVSIALEKQPTLRQARASVDVASAHQDEALAPLLPQVTAQVSDFYKYGNFVAVPSGSTGGGGGGGATGATGVGTPGAQGRNVLSGSLGASQLIWDFNQTLGKYRSAKETRLSQEDTERATRLLIVLTARTAYFTARANKELVQVQKQALDAQDQHLKQTQGFVTVGTQPEIALATARTSRANAQVALITAENNYDVAKAQLNQAIGVEQGTDYDVTNEALPAVASEDEETDKLLPEALAARPEFGALEHQLESQRELLSSVRGGYLPTIAASSTFSDSKTGSTTDATAGTPFWNWSSGLTVQWQLFQGGLTPAQVREQDADIASLEAQRDAERLQVRLEVDQGRLAVRAAKASLLAANEALINAEDQLRLAEGRFQTGVGNIIELTDAQSARTTAAGQKVQAEFNVAAARALLIKALGRP